jgi:predicted porin
MNNQIKLAVAAALLAAASSASAAIVIPAGDWTLEVGGFQNMYYTHNKVSTKEATNSMGTGLLPNNLSFTGKTRQNDLDIQFTTSFFTGSSSGNNGTLFGGTGGQTAGLASNTLNIRQAFLSFGDKTWGSIKLGRDLGVFGSDAILSDMTLLGVGSMASAGGSSTLGRIGAGYMYADWFGQAQYTTPNFNGFQATVAAIEPINASVARANTDLGYQAKVTYDFAANDITGRVWLGATTQKQNGVASAAAVVGAQGTGTVADTVAVAAVAAKSGYTSRGYELGAKASVAGFDLVAYGYSGDGLSGANGVYNGVLYQGNADSNDNGGYVQATYKLPTIGTKLGASWGQNNTTPTAAADKYTTESWIVGAYHPLTKSLNIVLEYSNGEHMADKVNTSTVKTTSVGAILFF